MSDAIAELRREIHKRGYDTKKSAKGHWQVFDAEGVMVRTKKGIPIEFASTLEGGRSRALSNTVSMLRSAGVLPQPKEVKPSHRPTKIPRDVLKGYSDTLREELKSFMVKNGLEQTDVWHYAWWYNTEHPPLLMSSEASAQTTVSRFLGKNAGLSNSGYTFLSRAFSAMKTLDGNVPRAQEIRTRMTASAPQPEPAPIEVEGESSVKVTRLPDLAFEVMQAIYREDKDHDAILDLVQRIARLELGS